MKELKNKYQKHMLICTHKRDPKIKECCFDKGAAELRKQLKEKMKTEGLSHKYKVIATSCLGHCERGIAAYVYPDKSVYLEIKNTQEDLRLLNNLFD